MAKKLTDSEKIDAIIAVLAANGMSLPKGIDPAPEPAPEPVDAG